MAGRQVHWHTNNPEVRKQLAAAGALLADTAPAATTPLSSREFAARISTYTGEPICIECTNAKSVFTSVQAGGGCTGCQMNSIFIRCYKQFAEELRKKNPVAVQLVETMFRDRNAFVLNGKTITFQELLQ